MDLKFYLSLFWRRLPYFLILLAIGSAIGVTLATVLPPVYVARAVLIVESQQIPDELAASTVETKATEQLQIIQQRILTRDSLIEMANRLEVYVPAGGDRAVQMAADEIVTDMRSRIRIATTGGASRRGPTQATIVTVSFRAPTGALSARVTNELVTLILQENVEIRTNVAGQTLEFFVQEVARLDQELATLGAQILEFQQANINALPDSLDFRRNQQSASQERLLQLERESATLRDRRNQLITLFETTGRVENLTPDTRLTPEQRQLRELNDDLANALVLLSPQNPRIRVLEARIAALETAISAQQAAAGTALPEDGQLSAFDIQLADIDGQLAFQDARRIEIETRMEELRVSIEATPGNSLILDGLQRDYSNVRSQYDDAVDSRARAETGDTIEALSKGQRISVIEQAIAPREPDSPNRTAVAAAGIGGGLVLGLAFVVLLELLNRSIRRPVELTARLGITPFGTLPLIRTRREILRRRLIIAAAFALVLVVLPTALWFVQTQIMPLDQLLDQILAQVGLAGVFDRFLR
jgi:uncharacterized protein involved in exopolysaccharide biosynthesis